MPEKNTNDHFVELFSLFQQKRFKDILTRAAELHRQGSLSDECARLVKKAEEFVTAEHFTSNWVQNARSAIAAGDIETAHREIARIEQLDAQSTDLPSLKENLDELERQKFETIRSHETGQSVENLFEEGLLFYYQGQWPNAIKRFELVLSDNPGHMKARKLLVECRLREGSSSSKYHDEPRDKDDVINPIISDFLQEFDEVPADSPDGIERQSKADDNQKIGYEIPDRPLSDGSAIAPPTPTEVKSYSRNDNPMQHTEPKNSFQPTAIPSSFSFTTLEKIDQNETKSPQSKPAVNNLKSNDNKTVSLSIFNILLAILAFFILVFFSFSIYQQYITEKCTTEARVEQLIRTGELKLALHQFDEAREKFTFVREIDPDNEYLTGLMEKSYAMEDEWKEEQRMLAEELIKDAQRYLNQRLYDQALHYLELAEQKNPMNMSIGPLRDLILQAIEKQKAEEEKRLSEKQKDIKNFLIYAEYHKNREEFSEAINYCQRILKLDPNHVLATELLRQIHDKMPRKETRR